MEEMKGEKNTEDWPEKGTMSENTENTKNAENAERQQTTKTNNTQTKNKQHPKEL